MASHVITYIVLLSGSLAAFKSSDKAAIGQYMRLSFFFSCRWLLHLFCCSFETTTGRYDAASIMTDGSILLFLFVPASNVYLRNRSYEGLRPFDWNYLRHMLLKFISNITGYLQLKQSFYVTSRKAEIPLPHSAFLTKERAGQIEARVRRLFEEKKPYLQPGYSLQMLSDETQISVHHLSAFINENYKINFNSFINEHRVIICIEKLMQKEWQFKKLEAIAQECGFNNRNTFTSAFKKTTGVNPSEFLRQMKLKNPDNSRKYVDKDSSGFDSYSKPGNPTCENIA